MAKILNTLIGLVCANADLARRLYDELAACPNDGKGSMTLSRKGSEAKATIMSYKIPLTDEKRIRTMIQAIDSKLQLSRSNNLELREGQYGFTHSQKELLAALKGKAESKADDKAETSDVETVAVMDTPTDTTPTADGNADEQG